ncbi:4-amino-4-deoxy-L-arabinose transferase [Nocardioides exalbidus]|uniref:4-amino-4-deoxy-L-arabinose transferase n=1 Tax=Nocardioides exalbidus TaxID=402596 RepID=A0A1H4I5T5_9ACTN|nr:glycosyltransferase family 39 protein [Nocardioides exalbidus]SEB28642.1 4-amino-4-deoxy-L-arabinose transferase [Nocardioides exalbidus]
MDVVLTTPTPPRARPDAARPARDRTTTWLAVVVVLALAARLVAVRHGLPHAYNADEELHFVPQAARAADGDWYSGYFENPSGLTYLLALVFRAVLPGSDATMLLVDDPALVLTVARLTVVLLGTASVVAVALAGRVAFGRRAGTWSAAFVGLSFLPVFYGHHALNDAPTLLPTALALAACLRLHERGGTRLAALAGLAVGLAAGVKYLAAPMTVVVGLALLLRVLERRQRLVPALRDLLVAAVACVGGLLLLNPFMVLEVGKFWGDFSGQSAQAATVKLGQAGAAWAGYPVTLLWGFGVVPVVLAVAGVVLAWRIDRGRTLLLVIFPVVLYLLMSSQDRWFARWLLPAYPALAVLAGLGATRLAALLRGALPGVVRPLAAAVVAVLALGQPVVDVVRSDLLLTRTDTRTEALDWLAAHPEVGRVVVEPAVPGSYRRRLRDAGLELRPVSRPFQAYELGLTAALLDDYRAEGWCWVMVNGHQRDRGLAAGLPGATAYYRRLTAESEVAMSASPFATGTAPTPFSYDFSFNYYPPAHQRPGPVVEIRRLDDCTEGTA